MNLSKKFLLIILILLNISQAIVFRSSEKLIQIPAGEVIHDDLYLAGNIVIIDADIEGDIFAIAKEIYLNGTIHGNINIIAQNAILDQKSVNTIRILAKDLTNTGTVKNDMLTAGETITIGKTSQINGNLLLAATAANISGTTKGNVNIRANTLTIDDKTNISGNLEYLATDAKVSDKIKVGGKVIVMEKKIEEKINERLPWIKFIFNKIVGKIYGLTVMFIFGIGFIIFLPARLSMVIKESVTYPGKSLLTGSLVAAATPAASIVLAFTFIGLPFSLILVSIFGFAVYISKIFVAIITGKYLIAKIKKTNLNLEVNQIQELFIGLITLFIINRIPILGFIFSFVLQAITFGAFIKTRIDMYRLGREKGVF